MLPSPVRTALLLARHFEWILLVKTRNRSAHAYTGYTEHTLDTFSSNRAEFTNAWRIHESFSFVRLSQRISTCARGEVSIGMQIVEIQGGS